MAVPPGHLAGLHLAVLAVLAEFWFSWGWCSGLSCPWGAVLLGVSLISIPAALRCDAGDGGGAAVVSGRRAWYRRPLGIGLRRPPSPACAQVDEASYLPTSLPPEILGDRVSGHNSGLMLSWSSEPLVMSEPIFRGHLLPLKAVPTSAHCMDPHSQTLTRSQGPSDQATPGPLEGQTRWTSLGMALRQGRC